MQIFKDRHAVACRENDYCVQMNLCPTDDDVNATAEPKSAHKQRGKGKGKQRLVIQDLVSQLLCSVSPCAEFWQVI